ncbi:hypothetical protein [Bradyrhizobium sp. SHOUNA76]|uniref:hypothetical protein n=1 Tax=Bradyrhizobium sp. SHOUNA76 TaxID=2908927 RepID=UPI001FF4E55B|nr:hypothetical protein [Bradyrhizobium sp. SHOUNA76]MCJ9700813.1 hypothetical protein [Bradyrhizobium sp. SHOUNA76]
MLKANLAAKGMLKSIVKSEGLKAHPNSRGSSKLIDLPNRLRVGVALANARPGTG